MVDWDALLVFLGVNLVVVVVPGPAVLYTVSRSLAEGKRAGLLSVYGLALGTFPHAAAVGLGVAGALASSATAFAALKYLGAGYLVYLGIRRIRERGVPDTDTRLVTAGGRGAFLESFTVGVLNPKAILFFGAFLPQFVDPARGSPLVQILVFWFLSQVTAVAVGSGYALAAGYTRERFLARRRPSPLGAYLVGSVFIGLGVAMAFSGSTRK